MVYQRKIKYLLMVLNYLAKNPSIVLCIVQYYIVHRLSWNASVMCGMHFKNTSRTGTVIYVLYIVRTETRVHGIARHCKELNLECLMDGLLLRYTECSRNVVQFEWTRLDVLPLALIMILPRINSSYYSNNSGWGIL